MMDGIIQQLLSIDPKIITAWGPVIVGILAILTSFLTNWWLLQNQRRQNDSQNEFNARQFELAKSKEEKDAILAKLNSFYGPFKQLRTQSKILYGKFATNLQGEYKETTGNRFRTLRYLVEGKKFTGQDDDMLKQILQVGQKQLELIQTHSGVVDRPEFQELLGKLCAHIRILQLAYDGKLQGPAETFEDIVFPLAIDSAIESAILRLQNRLAEFSENNVLGTPSGEKLAAKNSTIEFYDSNAEAYANQTIFLDLSELYSKFRDVVPAGGRILDAGCGVGRDTRYFIENGYVVISFDESEAMVRKCQEYPHAYCLRRSFLDITFKEEFDGIWACASLLHLNRSDASAAIIRLTTALKPGGAMFVSVKIGKGHKTDRGRYFEYYDDDTIDSLFNDDVRLELVSKWKSVPVGARETDKVQWLNLLLKRKSHRIQKKELLPNSGINQQKGRPEVVSV